MKKTPLYDEVKRILLEYAANISGMTIARCVERILEVTEPEATAPCPTVLERSADRLAYEVKRLVERDVIDSRSAAADALLDYGSIRHGHGEPINSFVAPEATGAPSPDAIRDVDLALRAGLSLTAAQTPDTIAARRGWGAITAFLAAHVPRGATGAPEPTRYDLSMGDSIPHMAARPTGDYVRFTDHAATVAALTAELKEARDLYEANHG